MVAVRCEYESLVKRGREHTVRPRSFFWWWRTRLCIGTPLFRQNRGSGSAGEVDYTGESLSWMGVLDGTREKLAMERSLHTELNGALTPPFSFIFRARGTEFVGTSFNVHVRYTRECESVVVGWCPPRRLLPWLYEKIHQRMYRTNRMAGIVYVYLLLLQILCIEEWVGPRGAESGGRA